MTPDCPTNENDRLQCSSATPACSRCELPPTKLPSKGRLFLWHSLGHSTQKVNDYLQSQNLSFQPHPSKDGCSIFVTDESIESLRNGLATLLSSEEQASARALFMEGDAEPGFADFSRVVSLAQFLATASSQWLLELLSECRFTSYFQPIVSVETETIIGHEALFRGLDRSGGIISPAKIFAAAKASELLFQVDLTARTSAIRAAARHQLSTQLFVNFTPTSIYDPEYCLRSTVNAIRDAGLIPQQIVFEVIESEQVADVAHLRRILDYYRKSGFKTALDDVGSGFSSLNLLSDLRPDIMKLDAALTRNVHCDPYKATIAARLLDLARDLGIASIAEGVETREEFEWLRSHGSSFVQGYYFARPAEIPLRTLSIVSG